MIGLPIKPRQLRRYPEDMFVGTVMAPRSGELLAIYVSPKGDYAFLATTVDRERAVGQGTFGPENTEGCTRQHMNPGLFSQADHGLGLGAALYMAGSMVNAAAYENVNGQFPWDASAPCTYSRTDEQEPGAGRAWRGLVRHGLATQRGNVVTMYWKDVLRTGFIVELGLFFRSRVPSLKARLLQ